MSETMSSVGWHNAYNQERLRANKAEAELKELNTLLGSTSKALNISQESLGTCLSMIVFRKKSKDNLNTVEQAVWNLILERDALYAELVAMKEGKPS